MHFSMWIYLRGNKDLQCNPFLITNWHSSLDLVQAHGRVALTVL